MVDNSNTCCCDNGREEVQLQEHARTVVVLVDEDCECPCDEVELDTDRQPDIVLFDEYAEEYIDDIVLARQAAEAARDTVYEKSAVIIKKENLILEDAHTIKRELRSGVSDIRADISDAKSAIQGSILGAEEHIREDIAALQFPTIEETSEEDIYDMFDDLEPEESES